MRRTAIVAALLLVTTALSGCSAIKGIVDNVVGPQPKVEYTPLETGTGKWNTDDRFRIVAKHESPVTVRVELKAPDGTKEVFTSTDADVSQQEGTGTYITDFTVRLPDGTWTLTYFVDGKEWDKFGPVQVDTTAPVPQEEVETLVNAPDGAYAFGKLTYESGADLELVDLDSGTVLTRSLPYTVRGLDDGLHSFLLRITDAAGNRFEKTIHVRVGEAVDLDPDDGEYTFGVLARYTREVALWDLTRQDEYLPRSAAQTELAGAYMGAGYGITPDHPSVQGVVAEVVTDDMNTMEAARALFIWMFDNLEYDDERLASNTLMLPYQVIDDAEDPDGEAGPGGSDEGDDGLADDGPGNGVLGGVCRDLAGTYISLLRAAGVPARIVSGYLAGNVNGFHAWVEFYAGQVGDNPGPWIPVDISPIDGSYSADDNGDGVPDGMSTLLQSFAVALPEYLPLRHVPEAEEVAGWSTALSVYFEFSTQAPELTFEKSIDEVFEEKKVLCLNVETLARALADTPGDCDPDTYGHPDGRYLQDFVWRSEQRIDYGIALHDPGTDACITATVGYPDHDSGVDAATTPYVFYGTAITEALERGKAVSQFSGDDVTQSCD